MPRKATKHIPNSFADPGVFIPALEKVRDCGAGPVDPNDWGILEDALGEIWRKINEIPSYIMTRNEFSLFNHFQGRFTGNTVARAARARYWDKTRENEGQSAEAQNTSLPSCMLGHMRRGDVHYTNIRKRIHKCAHLAFQ